LVAETPGSFHSNQYHNPDNANQHYKMTGPEIWNQFGEQMDAFVGGVGTGGTLSGVGRFLKEKNPKIQVIMADPVGSILSDLYYHKKVINPPAPYKVEGVGEDMLPDNVHFQYMDGVVNVTDQESFDMTRQLIAQEGLCVGPSSAMALVGAMKWSKTLTKPSKILILFPDNGRGYISKAFNPQWLKENKLWS
jgi:cystathionine beta-synthase